MPPPPAHRLSPAQLKSKEDFDEFIRGKALHECIIPGSVAIFSIVAGLLTLFYYFPAMPVLGKAILNIGGAFITITLMTSIIQACLCHTAIIAERYVTKATIRRFYDIP